MNGHADIGGICTHFYREPNLGNQVTGIWADDCAAE